MLCASARAESISKRAPSVRTSAPLNASGSQRLGGRDGRGPLKTPNSAWNATVQRTDAWRPPPGSSSRPGLQVSLTREWPQSRRRLMRAKRCVPISCRHCCRRKEPLPSGQRSRCVERRGSAPIFRAGRDNFRDNRGDSRRARKSRSPIERVGWCWLWIRCFGASQGQSWGQFRHATSVAAVRRIGCPSQPSMSRLPPIELSKPAKRTAASRSSRMCARRRVHASSRPSSDTLFGYPNLPPSAARIAVSHRMFFAIGTPRSSSLSHSSATVAPAATSSFTTS